MIIYSRSHHHCDNEHVRNYTNYLKRNLIALRVYLPYQVHHHRYQKVRASLVQTPSSNKEDTTANDNNAPLQARGRQANRGNSNGNLYAEQKPTDTLQSF